MSFDIAYREQQDLRKVVQAVMIDARHLLGIGNEDGNYLQPIIDAEIVSIGVNPYFFSLQSEQGSLAGYFVLNDDGTIKKKLLRPSYLQFDTQIDSLISNFSSSGDWRFYTLK